MTQELPVTELHILDDLTKQDRRDIATAMDRHSRAATVSATVSVSELFVRTALSGLGKSERDQNRDHLTRLEDREAGHLRSDRLDPHELGFELGLAVLQEHRNDLSEIPNELLPRRTLRVRSGESRDMPDEKAGLGVRRPTDCKEATTMRVASVAVLLLAVGHAMAEGQQSPPPVHIEEGACPFECCQYGRWMAGARVSLRAGPGSSEPIVGTIEVGDTVTAETGHVRSNPTAFVVRAPFEGFEAGDTVWVLSYLGEGYFNVWHEGALREAGLGFSPYGGSFGTRCAGCRHGEMVDELDATWWVRIRLGSGIVGWTSETDELYGKDACACL